MMDPEVQSAIEQLFAGAATTPPAEGDWLTRRQQSEGFYSAMLGERYGAPQGSQETALIPVDGDEQIRIVSFEPKIGEIKRNVVYFHGGGFIGGSISSHESWCDWLARSTESRVIAVSYRLAPEVTAPTPQEDCFAATKWIAENVGTSQLHLPLVVAGDSSGAGLAASVALMARDRGGPAISAQMLIQPMLDDRPPTPADWKLPYLTWSLADNNTAWFALLGDRRGTEHLPSFLAPAREKDLSGLPPTYLELCELDLFFDEGFEYLQSLVGAGVRVDAQVLKGTPHAFDVLAPHAAVTKRSIDARCAFLNSIVT